MHSRIIEISEKPIASKEHMKESSIPEWFCESIADYIDDDTDRENDIEWLLQQLNGVATYSKKDNSLCFELNARKKYFATDFIRFNECLKEFSSMTEEEFSGETGRDTRMMMFHLIEAYSDEFGFYIYSEDYQLETLQEWMRRVDLSKKYYIGSTLDYHW